MHKKTLSPVAWFALIMSLTLLCISGCENKIDSKPKSYNEYRDREFTLLTQVRTKKTQKMLGWLNEQKSIIQNTETQTKLLNYFCGIKTALSGKIDRKKFFEINNEIEQFFVYDLFSFYDLLFIDETGDVFYSVKMEDDNQTSLFNGPYGDTALGKTIQSRPTQISYVDFEYYGASDEPAAFYVLPLTSNNRCKGWVALQLSINRLNKLLIQRSGLGLTGEAYLVNQHHLMLTESRFINDDTVLSKQIDSSVIQSHQGSSGEIVIDDYRGIKVLSSYQSFNVGGFKWQILVEKDENEVVTSYYQESEEELFLPMVATIEKQTEKNLIPSKNNIASRGKTRRVDVGDLLKSDSRKSLFTAGVATCTGIAAYLNNDEFAYMAHLSPADACYNLSKDATISLGDNATDLVALMMRRIQFFEIKPHQIGDLRFCITATHSNSLRVLIKKLLDAGIFLSQIKVGILPKARSVSFLYTMPGNSITAQGNFDSSVSTQEIDFKNLPDLGEVVRLCNPSIQ